MSLSAWTWSCLRPYRGRVAILTTIAIINVALGVLAPWPSAGSRARRTAPPAGRARCRGRAVRRPLARELHPCALAQPVAREAALYATARSGALLSGLESLDRLATATSFAFEDVGVLRCQRLENAVFHWNCRSVAGVKLKLPRTFHWWSESLGRLPVIFIHVC